MKTSLTCLVCLALLGAASHPVQAGGSAEASAQALTHSMEAVAYSLEGSLKLVSAAAAVPLMTAGEIGKASGEIGNEFWEEANSPPHGPLPVTDEVITVGPKPDQQLNGNDPR